MLISIITVCYNSETTIEQTIQSVLHQTYSDIEYILVDGQSQDNTLNIIKKYETAFKGRMKWSSEKDQGIYDAINKGIQQAQGEIIGIIHSNDWYEANTVEHIVDAYQQNPQGEIFYGLLKKYDSQTDTPLLSISYYHTLLPKLMITHPTCFVKNKTYQKQGLFDLNYKLAADYEFMLRCYLKKVTFVPIDKLLANFRMGGASEQYSIAIRKEVIQIQKKYKCISNFKYFVIYFLIYARYFIEKFFLKERIINT